ncbi:SKP1 1A [Olea europaea subsp. europaea]|uniref:SKP1-like protein n=1 Tax=Olea europaea subsp. europaea TaxID=158383 RepID=A0A8S0UUL1_OLEEU|nr:SKP1 1A [Olea europaea subsp. europaea]
MSSSTELTEKKVFLLKSLDGVIFEVEESVAVQLEVIRELIEGDCARPFISLYNVTSEILALVIEYCKHHAETCSGGTSATIADEDLKTFDNEFMNVDENILLELCSAADYLDIKSLFELTCRTLASLIKDRTIIEVRKMFNVENDFSVVEEKAVRKEFAWAFK